MARATNEFLASAALELQRMSNRALVRALSPDLCDPVLTAWQFTRREYSYVFTTDRFGDIVCASGQRPFMRPVSVAERSAFNTAIQTRDFSLGSPSVGRLTGEWSSFLAQPIKDDDGDVIGVVGALVDLIEYQRRLDDFVVNDDTIITLVDASGVIIARSQQPQDYIGRSILAVADSQTVLTQSQGNLRTAGIDGVERLYSFTSVPATGWRVVAGVEVDSALSNAHWRAVIFSVAGLVALAAAVAAAWHIARRVERPTFELAHVARSVSAGRLDTRATIDGPAEIADVAQQLNQMLDVRQAQTAQITEQARLLDLVADAVIATDLDFRLRYLNQATRRLFVTQATPGARMDELAVQPETQTRLQALMREVSQVGEWRGELNTNSDTGPVVLDVAVARTVDVAGRPDGYLAVCRDITLRKRAEQRLERAAERLGYLFEMDRAVLRHQSPQLIAEAIVAKLRELLPCDRASITLFDHEAGEAITYATNSSVPTFFSAGRRVPLNQHNLEQIKAQRLAVLTDLEPYRDVAPAFRVIYDEGIRSEVLAAMLVEDELIGLMAVLSRTPAAFTDEHAEIVLEAAAQAAVALHNARLLEAVAAQNERLRGLAAELARAQERERRNLARDLHDDVGQTLTALNLNLSLVYGQAAPLDPVSRQRLEAAMRLTTQTVQRVRGLMVELHPPMLDDYGLLAALRWHADQVHQLTGLPVKVEGESISLPPETGLALFRICQEAVNNAVKSAQASQVEVHLSRVDRSVRLTISDDGVGFDLADSRRPGTEGGWGLTNMEERARAVGGRVLIFSAPGTGTRVVAEIEAKP